MNNATRPDYQPASTFKPLIFAAALEEQAKTQDGQDITADTVYDGTSGRSVKGSSIGFAPPNEDNQDYGDVTVQTAMNKSINSVFAQMGVHVGMDEVLKVAGKLGMDTKGMQAVPAQTLAPWRQPAGDGGHLRDPRQPRSQGHPGRRRLGRAQGQPGRLPEPDRRPGHQSPGGRHGHLGAHRRGQRRGTAEVSVAQAVYRNGQQVAGKTGTSDNNKSAWFTGYTPNLVTSVGLFGEVPKDRKDSGGKVVKQGTQVSLEGRRGRRPCQRWRLPGPDMGGVHLQRDGSAQHVLAGHHPGRGDGAHHHADDQRDADRDAVADPDHLSPHERAAHHQRSADPDVRAPDHPGDDTPDHSDGDPHRPDHTTGPVQPEQPAVTVKKAHQAPHRRRASGDPPVPFCAPHPDRSSRSR